jgi:hypothetical protein
MSMLGQNAAGIGVIPPAALEQQLAAAAKQKADAAAQATAQPDVTPLVGYIKGQFEIFRNHRNTVSGWSERLLVALRTFKGMYDPSKLQQIRQFGGSEVYATMIAQKCRSRRSAGLPVLYCGTCISARIGCGASGRPRTRRSPTISSRLSTS